MYLSSKLVHIKNGHQQEPLITNQWSLGCWTLCMDTTVPKNCLNVNVLSEEAVNKSLLAASKERICG